MLATSFSRYSYDGERCSLFAAISVPNLESHKMTTCSPDKYISKSYFSSTGVRVSQDIDSSEILLFMGDLYNAKLSLLDQLELISSLKSFGINDLDEIRKNSFSVSDNNTLETEVNSALQWHLIISLLTTNGLQICHDVCKEIPCDSEDDVDRIIAKLPVVQPVRSSFSG